jgi:hypothetical protein
MHASFSSFESLPAFPKTSSKGLISLLYRGVSYTRSPQPAFSMQVLQGKYRGALWQRSPNAVSTSTKEISLLYRGTSYVCSM